MLQAVQATKRPRRCIVVALPSLRVDWCVELVQAVQASQSHLLSADPAFGRACLQQACVCHAVIRYVRLRCSSSPLPDSCPFKQAQHSTRFIRCIPCQWCLQEAYLDLAAAGKLVDRLLVRCSFEISLSESDRTAVGTAIGHLQEPQVVCACHKPRLLYLHGALSLLYTCGQAPAAASASRRAAAGMLEAAVGLSHPQYSHQLNLHHTRCSSVWPVFQPSSHHSNHCAAAASSQAVCVCLYFIRLAC